MKKFYNSFYLTRIVAILIAIIILSIGLKLTFLGNQNTLQKKINTQVSTSPSAQTISILPSITIVPLHLPSQKCIIINVSGNKEVVFTKDSEIRVDLVNKINALPVTNILLHNTIVYAWDINT